MDPWIEAKSGAPENIKKHMVQFGRDHIQKQQLVTDASGHVRQMHELVQDQKQSLEALEHYHSKDKMSNTVSKAEPVDLVQVLAGASTDGGPASMSDGNPLPPIKMPWSVNDWAPQTRFDQNHEVFMGMSSQQLSRGLSDSGSVLLQPHMEEEPRPLAWSPEDAEFRPYVFKASLENIGFEFAPTAHAAIMRITPPSTGDTFHLSLIGGEVGFDARAGTIRGLRSENNMFFAVKALSPPQRLPAFQRDMEVGQLEEEWERNIYIYE